MQALVTTSQQNAPSPQVVVTSHRPNPASSSAIGHVEHQSQVVATANRSLEALWEKAVDRLCDDDKQHINTLSTDKRGVLEDVIKVVEEKRKLCTLKQWKVKKRGESVPLRDLFGNIIKWIIKFKEVGDTLVQYDPTHAAIPWAAVRFVLQAATSDFQTMEAMASALDYVTNLIAHYATVEDLYLSKNSAATQQLYDAIVRLYTTILVYLSRARRYYSKNTGNNRGAALSMERGFAGLNDKIDTFSGFNDKISELTERFESFQLGLYSRSPDTPVSVAQILEWLDAVYTVNEYERALSARLEGTCEWMFQRSAFQSWTDIDLGSEVSKVLWIHGAPGFGKTILCASLIEFLRLNVEGPVCYFFCDFGDDRKRQPQAILRSWIAQLVNYSNEAYLLVVDGFREKNDRTTTESELWSLFRKLSLAIQSCFFVIDGFDERLQKSQDNKRHSVTNERARFLYQLAENLVHTGSRVLLVSRESSEIRDEFRKVWQNASTSNGTSGSQEVVLRNPDRISFLDYHMTQVDTSGDINSFANSIAAARLPNKPGQLQKDLAQKASDKCDGMFLWIRLMYDRLSPGKNTKQLQRVISETPAGLEQAYRRDLMGITELADDERERALSILQWALFGCRPLTIRELTEALLVDIDDLSGSFPEEDLPDAWDEYHANDSIRKPCRSLIELRGQAVDGSIAEMTVHFVHFSVKEFLLKTDNVANLLTKEREIMNPIQANEIIARRCLTYLCYKELYRDHHSQKRDILELSKKHAFLNYAADWWYEHCSSSEEHSRALVNIANHFLDSSANRWMLFFDYRFYLRESPKNIEAAEHYLTSSPLHIASKYGLLETISFLMSQDVEIDVVCGRRGTALHTAVVNGQVEAVKLLLMNGASPTLAEPCYGSALHWLAGARRKSSVQTIMNDLLTSGADLEGRGTEQQATPLWYAAAVGCKDLVLWLLKAGAEVDAKRGGDHLTPLMVASFQGYQEVVEVLLRYCANVDAVSREQCTALNLAASQGHGGVVDLLLREGAKLDAVNNKKMQALHYASLFGIGDVQILTQLLDYGAEIESEAYLGLTPLALAVFEGQMATVEILLKRGANVHARLGPSEPTLLQYAVMTGRDTLLVLLLDHGADIEAKYSGLTPLLMATSFNLFKICKILLNRGANIQAIKDYGLTLVDTAIVWGDLKIVQLLLEHKDSPQAWHDQILALMQWVLSRKAPSAKARNTMGNWKAYIRLHHPYVTFPSDDMKNAEPSTFDLVIRRRDTSKPVRKAHRLGMTRVHFCQPEHGSRSRRGRKH